MASRVARVLLLALAFAGCAKVHKALPAACLDGPAGFERALARAPEPATLPDGTRLSVCVARARSDVELQALGTALTTVVDRLRARASRDPGAALRLGYLVGATRLGVQGSPGIAAQLGRRIERASQLEGATAATRAAQARGVRAGQSSG